MEQKIFQNKREPMVLLILALICLAVSGIKAYDPVTWVMEIFPIVIGAPILIFTYKRFPLSPLLYRLLFMHALILMIGGHYTYARVPLGFWVQDLLHLARNHYDRLGHLAQGFIPAILAREILLRTSPLKPGKWLFVIVTSICLAFSAIYEFIEWGSAIIGGETATDFLGTQGDVWDTQWDMFMCFIGAMLAQLFLAKVHDQSMVRIRGRQMQD